MKKLYLIILGDSLILPFMISGCDNGPEKVNDHAVAVVTGYYYTPAG